MWRRLTKTAAKLGVPESQLAEAWEAFQQADTSSRGSITVGQLKCAAPGGRVGVGDGRRPIPSGHQGPTTSFRPFSSCGFHTSVSDKVSGVLTLRSWVSLCSHSEA